MIGPLKDEQNKSVFGEDEMADILNDFFASVFTDEGDRHWPEEQMERQTFPDDIQISTEKVV